MRLPHPFVLNKQRQSQDTVLLDIKKIARHSHCGAYIMKQVR